MDDATKVKLAEMAKTASQGFANLGVSRADLEAESKADALKPTMRLRWFPVEGVHEDGPCAYITKATYDCDNEPHVLKQWWEAANGTGEWRPIEVDQ